jgi:hypothetical protein
MAGLALTGLAGLPTRMGGSRPPFPLAVPGWPERVRAGAGVSRSVPRLARPWLLLWSGRRSLPRLLRPVLARPWLAGAELAGGAAVLVVGGWHRSCARWACTRRPGARRTLARPSRRRPTVVLRLRGLAVRCVPRPVGMARLPGPASLAGPACLARLAGAPGLPLTAAVGALPGCHLVVIGGVTAGAVGAHGARGRRDAVAGNPPPVRHHGFLRRRTDSTGRLRSGAVVGRAPAVWLSPPGPGPCAAARRERRLLFCPGPRAAGRGRVARSLARRSGRESRPRRHAAVRTAPRRAWRHVGRPRPAAGAAPVAGIDWVGGRVQGRAKQLLVLRVTIAVGGFGRPATRATAGPGALTIHPLPPDPERVRRAPCQARCPRLTLRHSPCSRV